MTATMIDTATTFRFATDHQAALRQETATAHAMQANDRPSRRPLPPRRGPLAALRRRLAGSASFA